MLSYCHTLKHRFHHLWRHQGYATALKSNPKSTSPPPSSTQAAKELPSSTLGDSDSSSPLAFTPYEDTRETAMEAYEAGREGRRPRYEVSNRTLPHPLEGLSEPVKSATVAALSMRPTSPTSPWHIEDCIPRAYNARSMTHAPPMYSEALMLQVTNQFLSEIQADFRAIRRRAEGAPLDPALVDPWRSLYAWQKHPFFSFRNQLRFALPGLKYAVVAFIIYCIAEGVYDLTRHAKSKAHS